MQAWLAGIVTSIIQYVVTYFVNAWKELEKLSEALIEIDQETKKQAEDLKNAETEDEFEKAAKEIFSRRE